MSTVQATNLKHGSSASNNIVLDASGNTTISGAATISGNAVVTGTLQANGVTGSVYPLVLGTAQASTSGTAIDFTGIPSWARRVTVMFNGVSTNGTAIPLIQIGSSSGVETSGYLGAAAMIIAGASAANYTTGAGLATAWAATILLHGTVQINLMTPSTNLWVFSGALSRSDSAAMHFTAANKALAGALDRVRITTVGGTDLFDAGSINLLWE